MEDDQVVSFPNHEDNNNNEQKKRTGKRKIEIKPISNKTSRQVTFSKRRIGLFKKGSELCSLCGSEVAIITFSAANKLFTFGHPIADNVIQRYINFSVLRSTENNCNIDGIDNGNGNGNGNKNNFGELSEQYKKVLTKIEVEKRRTDVVSSSNGGSPRGNNNGFGSWWDRPIDNLGLDELEQFKVSLEVLRDEVCSRVDSINLSSSMSDFPRRIELDTNNQDVVARGCEDSAWINYKESVHPSILFPMNYSLFGNASEN